VRAAQTVLACSVVYELNFTITLTELLFSGGLRTHQNRFRRGLRPGPSWGSLRLSSTPPCLVDWVGEHHLPISSPQPLLRFALRWRPSWWVADRPSALNPPYGLFPFKTVYYSGIWCTVLSCTLKSRIIVVDLLPSIILIGHSHSRTPNRSW